MRRVVITGLGVISHIGNNIDEVTDALKVGPIGNRVEHEYAEMALDPELQAFQT